MNRCLIIYIVMFFSLVFSVAAETCIECHRKETPAAVSQWETSAHKAAQVGCAECHGSNHEKLVTKEMIVDAAVCGTCHEEEFQEHTGSRHGMGLHAGWGCTRNLSGRDPAECRFCHQEGSTLPVTKVQCARFLKQSSEMGSLGCNRCHQIENNCASCHTNHLTEPKIVQDPKICAKCHMGPDHPQWELWETSLHGTLHASAGPKVGPSCQRCHMPAGTHDVSKGLTSPPSMKPYPEEKAAAQREAMLAICAQCHAREFSRRELAAADLIREQSWEIVRKAEAIIHDLNDRDLLDPTPADRPAHPLRGHSLVTDGQMLYEDISHIERLFFKMKKYDLAKTVKGAYHQNPAYTHWYGNAELKMDLVDIQAESMRLQRVTAAAPVDDSDKKVHVETELKRLKKKFERGALSEEAYRKAKQELLQEYLSPAR